MCDAGCLMFADREAVDQSRERGMENVIAYNR
jgi:hypothetical protein